MYVYICIYIYICTYVYMSGAENPVTNAFEIYFLRTPYASLRVLRGPYAPLRNSCFRLTQLLRLRDRLRALTPFLRTLTRPLFP